MITRCMRQLLHVCGALLLTMAVTNLVEAQNGDGYQHVIVATPSGDVNEVYFKGGGAAIGQTRLAHFEGIVAIAGYFAASDNYQHVIVATRNGDVHEVYFKGGGAPIGQTRLAHFNDIVGVAGYFATSDNYQHVIVATRNGDVHEVYFKGGGAPIGQARLAHFNDIVAIAGYFAAGDNYQHVIVATRNGDVHEVYFKGGGAPIGQARLAHFDGIVGVAAYFGSGDNYQHVIVATRNGDVSEVYFKGGGAPIGQARLAHFDGIVGVAGYFAGGTVGSSSGLHYNEIQQRSIHNAYDKNEQLLDLLIAHRVRNIELDLHHDISSFCGGISGLTLISRAANWGIYHTIAEPNVNVCTLVDALKLLKAFHEASPNHEVLTIQLELAGMKSIGISTFSTYGPDMLDATLTNILGRQNIFTPSDLLAANPGTSTLFVAAGNTVVPGAPPAGNWPTTSDLRGKFIFVIHGDNDFQKYANASNANSRVGFIMHNGAWNDEDFIAGSQHMVFYGEVNDPIALARLRVRFPGLILRSTQSDDSATFNSLQAGSNLILTDKVDFHVNPWARTHNDNLFPFGRVNEVAAAAWFHPSVATLQEPGSLYVLKTYTGDLDGTKDSFSFAYSSTPAPTSTDSWTALVATVSNGTTHGWGKGLIMARASLDQSSPYFAVGRAADRHGLFIQWRSPGCGNGPCSTRHEELEDPKNIGRENIQFIRMDIDDLGNGSQRCRAFGSSDGKTWLQIFEDVIIQVPLRLRGMAASSLWTHHPNDSTEWFFFQDLRRNGTSLADSPWTAASISDRFARTTLLNLSGGVRVETNPVALPVHQPDPCQRIIDAIERLSEQVQRLEQELNEASGQERTILQGRIKTAKQQIKTEEQGLVRCRGRN